MFGPSSVLPIPVIDLPSFVFQADTYDRDKPIYIDALDPSRLYSYNEAKQQVSKLVAGFRAAGLVKGDCVLVNSLADIDYSIVFLAIIAAGGIWTGSNPFYTEKEAKSQLSVTKPKFILSEEEYLDRLLPVVKECGIPATNIFIFDHRSPPKRADMRSWRVLLDKGEAEWYRISDEPTAKATIAAYVMSSGTTGLPKAVQVSHYNFVAEQTVGFEAETRNFEVRRLLCLPQYATAAIYSNHVCPLRGGEVSYVMPRFQTESFIRNIEKFQISELTFMPPMIVSVLNSPLCTASKFQSVRYVHGGGAAISKSLQGRMKAFLPAETPFSQIWGMSETCGIAICLFHPEHDTTGSIGRLVPNLEAKLIDDNGNEIAEFNRSGELCIRGPTVMVGYLNNPEATAVTIDQDGWLQTGDICYCDEKTKKWYIVDRKKELIKVQGFQVAPAELEGILLNHPDIADAAVVGVNSPSGATELPVAFVIRRPGASQLQEQDVVGFVASQVISYKRLKGGVHFVESIPKSASGKVLKNQLRQQAKVLVRALEKL
ncbi:hypothetical protein FE257_005938 [Aspergillus nanangensis]|uniref:Uncharacterized protein n=1 Tax=Aspergillus nanangensis TaxID=2582783 RepID=A0AAD4GWH8_ASPNN|nr:hypothetical protein FE257_005938 [Aspergillus nanangensis]